jgi:hypothetical protein
MPVTGISRRLGTFDTLLMLGNNFDLCGSAVRARWLPQRFYAEEPLLHVRAGRQPVIALLIRPPNRPRL